LEVSEFRLVVCVEVAEGVELGVDGVVVFGWDLDGGVFFGDGGEGSVKGGAGGGERLGVLLQCRWIGRYQFQGVGVDRALKHELVPIHGY